MSDYSFLPHFITEDIYVIKEEQKLLQAEAPATSTAVEPAVAPTPSPAPVADAPAPKTEAPEPAPTAKPVTPTVDPAPPMIAKEPEPVYLKPLPTEGNNLKHCLLLVESDEAVLEAPLKALLEKIMGAVKRSLDDVLLVNVREANTEQIEALLSEQNHRHLIAFGTNRVTELNNAPLYQLSQVKGKNYLRADALSAIAQNIEMKKALWGALKGMF
ncbi:MAG: hypothetical protein HEP71_10425 [Roseivirga sp.]|nr:hypothetical protein [Roseivirga sp.]